MQSSSFSVEQFKLKLNLMPANEFNSRIVFMFTVHSFLRSFVHFIQSYEKRSICGFIPAGSSSYVIAAAVAATDVVCLLVFILSSVYVSGCHFKKMKTV